ncbi:NAC domain-containing protein 82-like [Fagus crenata]
MEMRNPGLDYLMDCLMGKESFPFPGVRFNPTDVELVMFFLMKKLMGRKFCEVIAELDVYKFAPEKLQDKSILKGDLNWYFFCPIEKKYSAGDRKKRSTEDGHWKVTGEDRRVCYDKKRVGSIKTLIFHMGKAPGNRTDWVMHEYRLDEEFLEQRGFPQSEHVLCKVFKKEGRGPRNGAQYGAPFKESDWNDDKEVCESCLSETVLSQREVISAVNNVVSKELPQSLGGAGTSQYVGVVSESLLSEHEFSKELDQALGGYVPSSTNEDKKNKKLIHDETAEVAPPLDESLENGFNMRDLDGPCGFQKPIRDGTAEVAPPLDESLENGFNLRDLEGPCGFQNPIHDGTAEVAPPLDESPENGFNTMDVEGLFGFQNVSHDGTAVATSPFDVSVFEDLEDLDNSILVEDLDKPLYKNPATLVLWPKLYIRPL